MPAKAKSDTLPRLLELLQAIPHRRFASPEELTQALNSRGYAVSQYMDPEPRKYAHPPIIPAPTFMLPEQTYYPNHPGRFFYVRDNDTGELFSAPYEPVRAQLDRFAFEPVA